MTTNKLLKSIKFCGWFCDLVEDIEFNKRFRIHGQTTLTMPTLCVICLLKAFMDMQELNVGTTWKKPIKGKEPMVDEEK
jgi:hypothetical protein